MTNKKKPRHDARQKQTQRNCTRGRLLAKLRTQSANALYSGNWLHADDLAGLLAVLKQSPPRARSINFCGVRFPLAWSLSCTVVCCPQTGQRLVARLDI